MVMAFEVPIYVQGLGGFNLEDQFIVEAAGPRTMSTLPRESSVNWAIGRLVLIEPHRPSLAAVTGF